MEEINRLTAQVIAADEAIAHRDEQLAKVRNEMDENIQLLQFQVSCNNVRYIFFQSESLNIF